MEYARHVQSFNVMQQTVSYTLGGLIMYLVGMRLPAKYGYTDTDVREELCKEINSFIAAGVIPTAKGPAVDRPETSQIFQKRCTLPALCSEHVQLKGVVECLAVSHPDFALYCIYSEWTLYNRGPPLTSACCVVGNRSFMGGESPSLADLQVFGILRAISTTDTFQFVINGTDILPWWTRMVSQVAESSRVEELPEM